ncbi:DUF4097 family beta strand repeat-containing protein [Streptosporangium roseum]|uniref:DUF4097 family beta strand repeat-containing protein n=1 Tax=Streptosporangium roseum TaxID=2001 RepID=UPI0004CCB906|nr:DUF4097 family beta strand repeat-containing protein [Streptosporangium roseum]
MPVFQTSGPVALQVKFPAGDLNITAAPREDTLVEVRPADPSRSLDVECAERTRVEQIDGTIFIEAPERHLTLGRTPRLEVVVGLPEGSRVDSVTASAGVRMTGALDDVSVKTASGDVRIDRCSGLTAKTASGDVTCDVTEGDAYVKTASGDVGLREVRGGAEISTSSGRTELGVVGGSATVKSASGRVRIRAAGGSVQVKSASADVTVDTVARGNVSVKSSSGDVVIGVTAGTNAWLDVSSVSGDVGSSLDQADQPAAGAEQVEIHVRTTSGDISITRAH